MPSKGLKDIRKALGDRCNRILGMYRRHCAPAVQAGQVSVHVWRSELSTDEKLILPEGFKLLPLYTLCMIKSKALKGEHQVWRRFTTDRQAATLLRMCGHTTCGYS